MSKEIKQIIVSSAFIGLLFSVIYGALYDRIDLVPLSIVLFLLYWGSMVLFSFLLFLAKPEAKKVILWISVIILTSPFLVKAIFFPDDPYYFLISLVQKCFPFNITLNLVVFEYLLFSTPSREDTLVKTIVCSHCNKTFFSHNTFCPHCHKLSHTIENTFNAYKDKRFLDFCANHGGYYELKCPHCDAHYRRKNIPIALSFGNPLRCCRNCGYHFVDNTLYEWALVSTLSKLWGIVFLFLARFVPLFFFIYFLISPYDINNKQFSVILASILSITACLLNIRSIANDSYERLNCNPEYPELLIRIGYDLLDKNYQHLYESISEERG